MLIIKSLSLFFSPRLLRSLYSGLPILWVPNAVQHYAGLCHLRLLCWRGLVFLLLLCVGGVWRLWPALWHGLWHHRCLLRVGRLPRDLYGVLQPLLLLLRTLVPFRVCRPSLWLFAEHAIITIEPLVLSELLEFFKHEKWPSRGKWESGSV